MKHLLFSPFIVLTALVIFPVQGYASCTEPRPDILFEQPAAPHSYYKPDVPECLEELPFRYGLEKQEKKECSYGAKTTYELNRDTYFRKLDDFVSDAERVIEESEDYAKKVKDYAECEKDTLPEYDPY